MHKKFIRGKKAQSPPLPRNANWAGSLIIAIGVLIIFYILFLPPNSRNEFLNITDNQTGGNNTITFTPKVVLRVNPGPVLPKTANIKYSGGHSIDDVRISALTGAKVIRTENPFFIRSNIFSSKTKKIMFKLADPEDTSNLLLSFTSSKHRGVLEVFLNNYEVMSYELSSTNVQPIQLPKDYLRENNTLVFMVSQGFLVSNYYNIENLKITAYVRDKSHSKSTSTFEVSDSELQTLESAKLTYYLKCYSTKPGKLSIDINGYPLGSFIPDCDSFRKIDFPTSYLTSGNNFITFETDSGDYLISQVKISPVFKSINVPTYYFELEPSLYDKIQKGDAKAILKIRFPDSNDKEGRIYVNGYVMSLSTKDLNFERVIDKDYLFKHTNALRIEPDTPIDITSLEIEVVKK